MTNTQNGVWRRKRLTARFPLVAASLALWATMILWIGQTAAADADEPAAPTWSELPPLPPAPGKQTQPGLAGQFVGVHGGAVIVAGGTNFPDGGPGEGGEKAWHDQIYVLAENDQGQFEWTVDESLTLPRPLAYGGSASTEAGMLVIGGGDSQQCYADVWLLKWNAEEKTLDREALPPLPQPLAFCATAVIDSTVYVAAGKEAMSGPRSRPTDHFWSLDLSANEEGGDRAWKQLPSWPGRPRILPVAAAQSRKGNPCVFLMSGREPHPWKASRRLRDAYCFDPAAGKWEPVAEVAVGEEDSVARCIMGAQAAGWGDDSIVFVGGDPGERFLQLESLSRRIALVRQQLEDEELGVTDRRLAENLLALLTQHRDEIIDTHPGFWQDVLLYNTAEDEWQKAGEFPGEAPVTTLAVPFGERLVLPSGEIKPFARTDRVWQGE